MSLNEVFWYDPDVPAMTDKWEENPYLKEYYKLYIVNDDNGLMECRITDDTEKSDEMDANPDDNCYFYYGDYVYASLHMEQIIDFLKGR